MAAVALAFLMGGPVDAEAQDAGMREIDETRQVADDVEVEIEALVREVRVTGWDRSEVRVRGAVHSAREEFVFEGDREAVRVEIDRKGDWGGFGKRDGFDPGPLDVRVPRGARVELEVVNGGLTVEDVDGTVEMESVNGGVRYSGGSEAVEAEAVNGSVRIEAPRSRQTRASSVNGDVVLDVGGGFVEVEAVSGDVEIRAAEAVETVSAETVSGDVEFRGRPTGGASFGFETHSGDVRIWLPGGVGARLEASTFSGEIQSAFGGEAEETSRWTPEKGYRQTVGSGEARISATSFSGDVEFRTLGG
jgi:DUF4097 and DUF4098 domain-containing protein YvlB